MHFSDEFLQEGINEFLESGSNEARLASCIVKTVAATELLLKEELENICPSLILEKLEPKQLIALHGLEEKLINKNSLKNVQIKTAKFEDILERASLFIKINRSLFNALKEIYKLRNELLHHHRAALDEEVVNVLLAHHIFPFLHRLLERMQPEGISLHGRRWIRLAEDKSLWKAIEEIREKSISVFQSRLVKKILHHRRLAPDKSTERYRRLMSSKPDLERAEVLDSDGLYCPACENLSLALILGPDFDWNPDGILTNIYRVMRCRICGIELREEEISHIESNLARFIPNLDLQEKWQDAVKKHDSYGYDENYYGGYTEEELRLLGLL